MRQWQKQLLMQSYPLWRPIVSRLGHLDYIARTQSTDKSSHGYTKYYEQHFYSHRNQKIKLLEIGVGGYAGSHGGASLRMWKDYFSKGELYGIDIFDKSQFNEPRINIFQGDQNNAAFLNQFATQHGPFDIIIDDGSHVSEHMVTSYFALFPHVKEGGLYVIEDLFFCYRESPANPNKDLDTSRGAMGMLKTIVDDIHYKYTLDRKPQAYGDQIRSVTFYPKICFIQKGNNSTPDTVVDGYFDKHENE